MSIFSEDGLETIVKETLMPDEEQFDYFELDFIVMSSGRLPDNG